MSRISQLIAMVFIINGIDTVEAAKNIQPRIIGGIAAQSSDWPYMASLFYKKLGSAKGFFCGATLIAKDWVLTSARCVEDEKPEELAVIVNRSNLLSQEGESIPIKEIIIHPNYRWDLWMIENNIALLKLTQPSTATPVETLPKFSTQAESGKNAVALGWGTTSASSYIFPDDLQQAHLSIVSNSICKKYGSVRDNMMCTGVDNGKDTCDGDGGGPLMVFDDQSKTWRQAGITSFGTEIKCADPKAFSVYTRLSNYKDFISQTICSKESIPSAPNLQITTNRENLTLNWTTSELATGYRLYYVPYPTLSPIGSLDMNQATSFSINLPMGSAFYVAVNAYNGNCESAYSNVEYLLFIKLGKIGVKRRVDLQ